MGRTLVPPVPWFSRSQISVVTELGTRGLSGSRCTEIDPLESYPTKGFLWTSPWSSRETQEDPQGPLEALGETNPDNKQVYARPREWYPIPLLPVSTNGIAGTVSHPSSFTHVQKIYLFVYLFTWI